MKSLDQMSRNPKKTHMNTNADNKLNEIIRIFKTHKAWEYGDKFHKYFFYKLGVILSAVTIAFPIIGIYLVLLPTEVDGMYPPSHNAGLICGAAFIILPAILILISYLNFIHNKELLFRDASLFLKLLDMYKSDQSTVSIYHGMEHPNKAYRLKARKPPLMLFGELTDSDSESNEKVWVNKEVLIEFHKLYPEYKIVTEGK